MKLREGDLEFNFTDAINAIEFDEMRKKNKHLPNYHGIGEMHRVDFIVEVEEAILFIEVKDPDNPKAQQKGLESFFNDLDTGKLSDTFASKFVDSFLFRWAENELEKPIHYVNLVTFDEAQTVVLSDEITKKLPPSGLRSKRWKKSIYENCQVFNLETWNKNFPQWQVTRISQQSQAGAN